MLPQSQLPRVLRFGTFEVDVPAGELRKNGIKLKLQEQPFQVLCMLVEYPGEVVTREQLRSRLWPADTFVDFDHGLNAAVKRLRDALGDDPDNPRFIETVPRRGYRFLATVSMPKSERAIFRLSRGAIFVSLGLFAGLGIAATYYIVSRPVSSPPMRIVPLTTYPGAEDEPTFSKDGEQVAFTWDANTARGTEIYVKRIGTENPLQLTQSGGFVCCPSWTSDNRHLAYLRCSGESQGIFLVPSLGGPARMVRQMPGCSGLAASPTKQLLAYGDKNSPDTPFALFTISLDDLQPHQLTFPTDKVVGDQNPVFSPDGESVAFIRIIGEATSDIFVVPLADGAPRQLTFDRTFVNGLTWTADGRRIVFSSHRGGGQSLWVVPVAGGEPARLPLGGATATNPAISPRGNRLAYTQGDIHPNLWVIELSDNPRKSSGSARQFLSSATYNNTPRFSPDGKRLAFASTRSGEMEIWTCDARNCSDTQQLTFLKSVSGSAHWSPDGKRIAFDSRPTGHSQVFVVSAAGGKPFALTDGTAEDKVPSWSSDGGYVYFTSNRSGATQIWRVSARGGQPAQVTQHGGYAVLESPDGKFLYYVKGDKPGVWRMPPGGGDEVRILPLPSPEHWGDWALLKRGIYYVDESGPRPAIDFFAFATHKVTKVVEVDGLPPAGDPGFTVSPDEKRIIFSQVDRSAIDLILVENFR
jgi:Tol biopolymer transport system component/DNA-binding winged helix-turn-helix (wHTH) protein